MISFSHPSGHPRNLILNHKVALSEARNFNPERYGTPSSALRKRKPRYGRAAGVLWAPARFGGSLPVESAIEKGYHKQNDVDVGVWAFNTEMKNLVPHIKVFNLPGATSANLAAQGGCFTCIQRKESLRVPDFDEALENELGHRIDDLWKITVPASESKEILDYCRDFGITAATLFPGYDGAAKAVQDFICRWDRF